ncbi:CS1 type fimbrial major subunit [Pseudomonas brenneri]|nr:CS1 type fimbrial major subunit [Pseudomonas brenneri]
MFKKFAIAAPLALLALNSSMAFAAGEATHTVNIKANIPTTVFHAQPRDPNFGRDESMSYNLVSGELAPLTAVYDVKNTNGSVHAYIEGGPAVLFNGNVAQNIALTTSFNGVEMTGTPKEVVTEADSTPGVAAELRIVAAKPSATQRGAYTSAVALVFDAVLPTTP